MFAPPLTVSPLVGWKPSPSRYPPFRNTRELELAFWIVLLGLLVRDRKPWAKVTKPPSMNPPSMTHGPVDAPMFREALLLLILPTRRVVLLVALMVPMPARVNSPPSTSVLSVTVIVFVLLQEFPASVRVPPLVAAVGVVRIKLPPPLPRTSELPGPSTCAIPVPPA